MNITLDDEPVINNNIPFVPTMENQIALLDQIRSRILANPESFDMDYWHSPCGTAHCIAGWAQTLSPRPTDKGRSAEAIGQELLPDFCKFFYGRIDFLFKWFEARAYALAIGEVARVGDQWIDSGCNFYDGELSQEDAAKQSASNKDCIYCTNCTGYTGCTSVALKNGLIQ